MPPTDPATGAVRRSPGGWLGNRRVRTKVLLAVVSVLLVTVGLGAVALRGTSSMNEKADLLYANGLLPVSDAKDAQRYLLQSTNELLNGGVHPGDRSERLRGLPDCQQRGEAAAVTNETIKKLGHSSTAISEVVKAITGIAQQTNLLALNATIEAARAGKPEKASPSSPTR